jgi:GntR family transcriptional regulator/MocR family aminotransferase
METVSVGTLDAATGGRDVFLDVELRRGALRRNLRVALREAIQDGRLTAGTRLPSSRRLASDLQVSRGVVADTYDQLAAEGYLAVIPRQAPLVVAVAPPTPRTTEQERPTWPVDFVATTPDVELFPRRAWLRAMERAMRAAPNAAFDYGDHRGRPELRAALRDYLGRVRGVRTEPGRIVVTQGFTQALYLLCRVLRAGGARAIIFETPSQPNPWETITAAGLAIEAGPVDAHGLRTDLLGEAMGEAVLVTPAHQFPTGSVMSADRRSALVAWARRRDRLIVEDDYDAEFRYDRMAIGAIQGLDPGRVVHLGTTSKTLAPGIRLGWMSLPAELVDEVKAEKAALDSGSPVLEQLALADLIASGDYDRHVARARQVYRHRRDALVESVRRRLPGLRLDGAAAGLHVLLRLPESVDDVAVARAAAEHGIRVEPLSPMSLVGGPDRGLVLGYSRLPGERMDAAVARLAEILRTTGALASRRPAAMDRPVRPRPRNPTPGPRRARRG